MKSDLNVSALGVDLRSLKRVDEVEFPTSADPAGQALHRSSFSTRGGLLATLVAACLSAAHAAEPARTWTGGADLRLREVIIQNASSLDDASPSAERHFQRYRARAWGQYQPDEALAFNARLMWEGRHYNEPDIPSFETWYSGAVMFDNLYLLSDRPGGLPLKVKLGRQDIILGNGWLMLDGTPLDGSRTIYFDALRATWSSGLTSLETILIRQDPKTSLTLDGETEDQIEQSETGLVLYLRNKFSADTDLDGFYFYKNNSPVTGEAAGGWRLNNGTSFPSASDDGHVNALGGRIETRLSPVWSLRAETAVEWGRRNGSDMRAFGFNGRTTRTLGGAWDNRLQLGYEFLSGDDPGTASRNEAFDPLWGRWPQWSELYGPYTYAMETRTGETTNLHRLNLGWIAKVHPTTELSLDYHALFADENSKCGSIGFSCNDKFRGHLFTAWLRAKFDEHLSGHLLAEYLLPGDYYVSPKGDNAYFLRAELNLTY